MRYRQISDFSLIPPCSTATVDQCILAEENKFQAMRIRFNGSLSLATEIQPQYFLYRNPRLKGVQSIPKYFRSSGKIYLVKKRF